MSFHRLDPRLRAVSTDDQVIAGTVAVSRVVPLLAEPYYDGSMPSISLALREQLASLCADPVSFAATPVSDEFRSEVKGWLDGFDDEPQGRLYWPFQAFVLIEYAVDSGITADSSAQLERIQRYLMDFAYFMDEELDRDDRPQQHAEAEFWAALVDVMLQTCSAHEALSELVRKDGRRLLRAVDDCELRRGK